jgi:hypothetical protein
MGKIKLMNDTKKILYEKLYGVHKELLKKHWAFEKCIIQAMEEYKNKQNEQNEH